MGYRGGILGKGSIAKDASKLRVLLAGASAPSGATDHGGLAGLSDDDHAQYMHISADRTVTAQHSFSPTTDKAPFTLGAHAQGQKVTGLNADLLDGYTEADFAPVAHNHDSDYISIITSPVAGNFPLMTSGGELATSTYSPASFVPVTRTVTAGAGLTGGGALSSDITLDVGAGTLISVGANTVGITPGSAQYQFIVSGGSPFTAAWSAGYLNIASGKTLTIVTNLTSQDGAGILSWPVGGATGTVPVTGTFAMGAGTLSVSSTSSVSGATHTHVITSSAAVTNETATLLATDGSGVLRLFRLGVGAAPDAQYDVDVAGNLHVGGYIVGQHAIAVEGAIMLAHYDGQRPYETDFTGETMGHMGQFGTVTGGVIFRPGLFGKGVQIAEAATNLCTNPSAETNTTGWTKSDANSSATYTRDATFGYIGSCSHKLVNTAGGENDYIYFAVSSPDAGTVYSISAYVYVSDFVAAADSNRGLFVSDTGSNAVATITGNTNGWVNLQVLFTTASPSTPFYVRLYAPRATVWWDVIQITKSTYRLPYLDGSLGSGHTWSGTAHASTSARTAASLAYVNPLKASECTIGLTWTPSFANTTAQATPYLFSEGNLKAYYQASDDKVYFTDGTNTISTEALTFDADAAQRFAFSWSSAGLAIRRYYDGAMDTTVTGATYTAPTLGANLFIGSDTSSANQCNGVVDELMILDHAMTDSEYLTIIESNAPVFAETSTWGWRAAGNLAWADQYGMWAIETSGNSVLGVYGASGTKSWGGFTMSTGDLVIGHNKTDMSAILWDQSTGKFGFYGNGSSIVQVEIDTDGSLTWGGGVGRANASGITVDWYSGSEINVLYGYGFTTGPIGRSGIYGYVNSGVYHMMVGYDQSIEYIHFGATLDIHSEQDLNLYSGQDFTLDADSAQINCATIIDTKSSAALVVRDGIGDTVFVVNTTTASVAIDLATPRQQLSIGNYLDLYSGNANSPSRPSIRASGYYNLVLNSYSTGGVYINFDGGTGGIHFHGGTSTEVGVIDSSGNMQLDGNMDVYGVYKVDGVQVVSNRVANIGDPTENTASLKNCCIAILNLLESHGLMAP